MTALRRKYQIVYMKYMISWPSFLRADAGQQAGDAAAGHGATLRVAA